MPTPSRSPTFFAKWWMNDRDLRPLDEILLTVMHIQPAGIDELDMEDYWFWIEAAEREIKRRNAMAARLAG